MSKETSKGKVRNIEKTSTTRRPFARKELVRDCGRQDGKGSVVLREGPAKKPLEYINVNCDKFGEPDAKEDSDENVAKLDEPQLLSTLQIAEEIAKVKKAKFKKTTGQLHPQSNLKPKTLKRINIPFEEQVYKDLINLSVKDEDLGIVKYIPKAREAIKPKDPEPVLSNFYEPKFDKEYVVKCPIPTYDVEKVWSYDGFSISDALKEYEIL